MIVLELPPSESYKILVNFDSLYGTWLTFPLVSVRAEMTLPKASRPLLMLIPSLSVDPEAPVFLALSDPARSTKWNLAIVKPLSSGSAFSTLSFLGICYSPFFFKSLIWCCSTEIVKMACEREDVSFMRVEPVER